MSKLFNESTLENAIIELLESEGYNHVYGDDIHKENSEVLLLDDLRKFLQNEYHLTDNEVNRLINDINHIKKYPLYEANKKFIDFIQNGLIFKRDDSNQKDLFIKLIDNVDLDNNNYKIVNQLEIEGQTLRIPDGIIYVNGLPLVVFEFKSAVKENTTIMNAYTQLTIRYRRDIEDLFKYNAFVVISDGINNKYGSLFSKYEYFYSWYDTQYNTSNDTLSSMIHGLFNKVTLINVIKNYIYFPDNSDSELKIICRYPQYKATEKLESNILQHMKPSGDGKGGTYFGATGCGKSYTMLFLSRKLMKNLYLKNPTILLITDRIDLDSQLAETFENSKRFVGDKTIKRVESREELKTSLNERKSGGVFLTTIQKFTEDINKLSERENIICISDEAHRSQNNLEGKVKINDNGVTMTYGFAKYLHDSLPNATYVGFTGTPIEQEIKTFGDIVDKYTMKQAVRDGITVNIVYEGRSAKVILDTSKLQEIEDYYKKCADEGTNEYQIDESKKAVTHLDAIIGDDDVLQAVAKDLVNHYENRVKEHATVNGKAMIVCMNRNIAYRLYKYIIKLRPAWAKKKLTYDDSITLTEYDKRNLKEIPMINMVMTYNKDDEIDLYNLLKEYSNKELDRQFKSDKSNFKIAIVVDMWITGFDVPSLDTMYIDKPLERHTLIQTISRVNRVYPNKTKGLIVDYFGIKSNMNQALKMYDGEDSSVIEDINMSVTIFKDTLDVLRQMLYGFDNTKFYNGTPLEKLNCLKAAAEFIQNTEDLEKRFMFNTKKLKMAFNLASSSDSITTDEKNEMYFYLSVRSIIYKLNKGDAPDITQMNNKVSKMIQDAIQSDGVEELFKSESEINARMFDIFSDEYVKKINELNYPNTKIKLLKRLITMKLKEYGKVNKIKSFEFSKRLEELVDEYNNRKYDKDNSNEILNNVIDELNKLLDDIKVDENSFKNLGIDYEEKAFYDILKATAKKFKFDYPEENYLMLSKEIKEIVDNKTKYTDWSKKDDIKAELKVDLILLLDRFNYPPITNDDVYKAVFEQAENFKKYND